MLDIYVRKNAYKGAIGLRRECTSPNSNVQLKNRNNVDALPSANGVE